jgi:hypothetical protein
MDDEVDMNLRRGVILLTAAALMMGCRQPDPTIDLLEAELRFMEDQLYLMEDQYQQACAQLASCRRENQTLRQEDPRPQPPGTPPNRIPRPSRDQRQDETDELSPPTIEEGEEMEPQIEVPLPAKLPLNIDIRPASLTNPVNQTEDQRVTHIVLNPHLTGGVDLDHQPGDEGLMLVVEPRNSDGHYVPLPGAVSIVVLDPSKTGQEARVARWDFQSDETLPHIRQTLFGRGIHFQLPWPHESPNSEILEVHVRYTTADGRRLETKRQIQADSLAPATGRWTPASPPRGAHGTGPAPAVFEQTETPHDLAIHPAANHADPATLGDRPVAPDPDSVNSRGLPSVQSSTLGRDSHHGAASPTARTDQPPSVSRRPRWSPYR